MMTKYILGAFWKTEYRLIRPAKRKAEKRKEADEQAMDRFTQNIFHGKKDQMSEEEGKDKAEKKRKCKRNRKCVADRGKNKTKQKYHKYAN